MDVKGLWKKIWQSYKSVYKLLSQKNEILSRVIISYRTYHKFFGTQKQRKRRHENEDILCWIVLSVFVSLLLSLKMRRRFPLGFGVEVLKMPVWPDNWKSSVTSGYRMSNNWRSNHSCCHPFSIFRASYCFGWVPVRAETSGQHLSSLQLAGDSSLMRQSSYIRHLLALPRPHPCQRGALRGAGWPRSGKPPYNMSSTSLKMNRREIAFSFAALFLFLLLIFLFLVPFSELWTQFTYGRLSCRFFPSVTTFGKYPAGTWWLRSPFPSRNRGSGSLSVKIPSCMSPLRPCAFWYKANPPTNEVKKNVHWNYNNTGIKSSSL